MRSMRPPGRLVARLGSPLRSSARWRLLMQPRAGRHLARGPVPSVDVGSFQMHAAAARGCAGFSVPLLIAGSNSAFPSGSTPPPGMLSLDHPPLRRWPPAPRTRRRS
jgi:hypothetical protein